MQHWYLRYNIQVFIIAWVHWSLLRRKSQTQYPRSHCQEIIAEEMVLYQIAIVDMDLGESASPVFHLSVTSFMPEDSILDALAYFCSATFHLFMPGMSAEDLIFRGLKHVQFFGIEKYGRQQRRVDVRTFDILWNDFSWGLEPLIDVTFFMQPKASIDKPAPGDTGSFFNIFLSPVDKKIALQQQESNQRGTFLPLLYSE